MNFSTDSNINSRMDPNAHLVGGNRNHIMALANISNIDPANLDVVDLSETQARPKINKFVVNPFHQKPPIEMRIRNVDGSFVNPFVGDDYGKRGNTCNASPSTLQGPRGLGGSNTAGNGPPKLDYFDMDSDDDSDSTPKPKKLAHRSQRQTNGMDEKTTTDGDLAVIGSKKRKVTIDRSTRTETPGLFVSPVKQSSKMKKAPTGRMPCSLVRHQSSAPPVFGIQTSAFSTQPSPSFGAQARGLNPFTSKAPSIDHSNVDIIGAVEYMKEQVNIVSTNIIQPVIGLTKMVKKLELENANLLRQLNNMQASVNKSISEVHERQNEHESLIDSLGNDIINPSGTAYGGPRNTAVKKSGMFQGFAAGQRESMGGPATTS